MTTPNMSGRTDAPTQNDDTLDPADLLDENGDVNISAVKSVTNSPTNRSDSFAVTAETCATARELLVDGMTSKEAARELTIGSTTVSKHARGACYHTRDEVDHPPVEYDGGEWVISDE